MTLSLKHAILVAQSCLTVCDPVGCSPPGSAVNGIFQARIVEWVAIPFSREYSQPRDQTWVSCTADRFSTTWATRKAPSCFSHDFSRQKFWCHKQLPSDVGWAAIIWRLNWGWKSSSKMTHRHGWELMLASARSSAGAPWPLQHGSLKGSQISYMAVGFPQSKGPRVTRQKLCLLLM